jgi:endonuclease/exonuclease/phosphatase family metal-dependent hydrolase
MIIPMRLSSCVLALLCAAAACNDATLTNPPVSTTPPHDGGTTPGEEGGTGGDADTPGPDGGPPASKSNLRVVAANISSGPTSTYDSGEGIRIFQALHADVALVQELNYGTNSDTDLKDFVTKAFGADYVYYRESGVQIPNGIVSRYPILTSGSWVDPQVANRGFAYAKIAVPGPHPLWAVSLHFLTTGAGNRAPEATSLVAQLGAVVADGDYVVLGGDLNTTSRTETCIMTLGQVVVAPGPLPVDQEGNDSTNGPRNAPYDWVMAGASLGKLQVPTVIGANSFPNGLVFDSRVYTPLEDVAPVMKFDSEAENMQHMPVVKDFAVPE